jgi:hypothetical protein
MLDMKRGILPLSPEEMAALAHVIRQALDHLETC